MLLLLLAATAQASAPPFVPPARIDGMPVVDPVRNGARCPPISRYEAARRGGKLTPNLLKQLPMADVYKAVYRRVGGCVAPIIVKYGVGRR